MLTWEEEEEGRANSCSWGVDAGGSQTPLLEVIPQHSSPQGFPTWIGGRCPLP